MSLFKLHRINSPEIRQVLKDREMRLEHTINLYRIFLFALFTVGDTTTIYLLGKFNRQVLILLIVLAIVVFGVLFLLHVFTRKKRHRPFLKYISVTIDLFFIYAIFTEFLDFIMSVTNISQKEFLVFATIMFIFFNGLSALRIRKYVIFYSTVLALILNLILHIQYQSSLIVTIYTSFFILISGFYNLWVSNFIMQSFIANIRLSNAMNDLKQANEEITAQRDQIERQNNRITDSISYASRIQNAVLTQQDEIKEVAPENFILYWPKDIVSGDFYWFRNVEVFTKQYKVIAVVDCTGHGVPGAFMSMLGTSFLDEIVLEFYTELKASEILNRLREEVKKYLHQSKDSHSLKDGMDLALCVIDYEDMKLQFAGAHNPLYLVRSPKAEKDNTIEELKGDRMPIGIYFKKEKPFTNQIIDIKKGDMAYLFSDGYMDQFGGKDGKKYNLHRFKEKLLSVCHLPLDIQKREFEQEMKKWMKNYNQIDDITLVGVKV